MASDTVEFDAGNAASVKTKEQKAKLFEARRLNGLKQIMDSADGRLWIWNVLSACKVFSVDFNGNSRDYFNLGQRNAGMPMLLEIQKHFLDQYIMMAKEQANV